MASSIGAVPPPACAEVEPQRWDEVLRAAGVTDVYYSRGFVHASAAIAGAEPVLLRLGGDAGDGLPRVSGARRPDRRRHPVRLRRAGRRRRGPAARGVPRRLRGLVRGSAAWSRRFLVFHPLLAQRGVARVRRLPPDPARRHGRVAARAAGPARPRCTSTTAALVRRARREGYDVTVDPAPADLAEFAAVYEQTMRRAGASPFYLFPPRYWEALRRDVKLVRVDVRSGGELLASVLGMGEPPWLHYHLGGATDAARGTGASHLALYTLAAVGARARVRTLHLGGGVGGRDDSLLEFKLRFAPEGLVGVSIGKAVHDRAAYLRLSGAATVDWDGFFPAYREPYGVSRPRLTGSRMRRASAWRSSRPRSCTSRRRRKLTLRISSLWWRNQRACRARHRAARRRRRRRSRAARARRRPARRRCAGRAGSSRAASGRPRSC